MGFFNVKWYWVFLLSFCINLPFKFVFDFVLLLQLVKKVESIHMFLSFQVMSGIKFCIYADKG